MTNLKEKLKALPKFKHLEYNIFTKDNDFINLKFRLVRWDEDEYHPEIILNIRGEEIEEIELHPFEEEMSLTALYNALEHLKDTFDVEKAEDLVRDHLAKEFEEKTGLQFDCTTFLPFEYGSLFLSFCEEKNIVDLKCSKGKIELCIKAVYTDKKGNSVEEYFSIPFILGNTNISVFLPHLFDSDIQYRYMGSRAIANMLFSAYYDGGVDIQRIEVVDGKVVVKRTPTGSIGLDNLSFIFNKIAQEQFDKATKRK